MKPGDLVRISGEGLSFTMWDDPYPFSDDWYEEDLVDKFYGGELGIVVRVEDVQHRYMKRASGIYVKYVKMMNPRGRIGWVIGSNLEVVGEDG